MGNIMATISNGVSMAIASIAAMIPALSGPAQALIPAGAVSTNPVGIIILIASFVIRHVPWNRLWEFVQGIFSRTEDRISAYSHLLSRAVEGPGSNSR